MEISNRGWKCLVIFVIYSFLVMFIGGAISYYFERIKEKTYVTGECTIIIKTKTCYRTKGIEKSSKFSSIYLYGSVMI